MPASRRGVHRRGQQLRETRLAGPGAINNM